MISSTPRERRRLRTLLVPATTVGRCCLASFAVGALGFFAMVVAAGAGEEGGDTFTDNWWISGPALVAALGLVGALATGLFAIARRHERAVPVWVATAIGGIVAFFIVGELITPH